MTDPWASRLAPALADIYFGTSGPRREASIILVGESWGFEEARAQCPFVGSSGQELDSMLANAGLARRDILCTNVFPAQPPGNEAYWFLAERGGAGGAEGVVFRGL